MVITRFVTVMLHRLRLHLPTKLDLLFQTLVGTEGHIHTFQLLNK